jgi:hypothetical protein
MLFFINLKGYDNNTNERCKKAPDRDEIPAENVIADKC